MLENFIYAKEKSLFEERLNNGEVLDEAIAFIEDTKEIWNHGTYFSTPDDVLKITEQFLTEEQKAQVKANLNIKEEVTIGDSLPEILPDLFVDTSRNYEEIIGGGIEDAPADGNLYARKNKAWEILKNSDQNMFPLLEDIGIIFDNGSVTEEQYNKILSFYDENKIWNGDYEASYASFWLYGRFCISEIVKTEDGSIDVFVSSTIIGDTKNSCEGFTILPDYTFISNYYGEFNIEGSDDGLSIQTFGDPGDSYIFLQTSGDGTRFLADNGEYVEIKQEVELRTDGDGTKFLADNGEYIELSQEETKELPFIEGYSESNRLTVQVSSSSDYDADIVGGFITAIKRENLNLNFITSGFYRLPIELSRSVFGNYQADVLIKKLDPAPSSNTSCMSSTVASCDLFRGYDVYISYFNGTIAKKVRRDSSLFSFEEINSDPFDKPGLGILTQNTFEGLQVYAETLIRNHREGYINLLYGTEVNKYAYRKEYTRDEYDVSFDVIGSEVIIYNANRTKKICKIGENGVSEANLIAPVSNNTTSFDMYMLCGYLYLKANTSGFTITNNKNVTKTVVFVIENDGTSEVSTSINGTQLTIEAGEMIVVEIASTHKDIFISKKYVN